MAAGARVEETVAIDCWHSSRLRTIDSTAGEWPPGLSPQAKGSIAPEQLLEYPSVFGQRVDDLNLATLLWAQRVA